MPQADTFIPYHVPAPSRRPTSVLVLGVVGIVLASLALLTALAALVMLAFVASRPGLALIMRAPREERIWQVVTLIASWGFASVLLWASISAIRLRPTARAGMLWWAFSYLTWLVVDTAVTVTWVLPASAAASPTPTPGTPSETLMAYAFLAASFVVNVTYPIFVIVFMRRPHVRAAFEPAAAAPVPLAGVAARALALKPPVAEPSAPVQLPPLTGGAEP